MVGGEVKNRKLRFVEDTTRVANSTVHGWSLDARVFSCNMPSKRTQKIRVCQLHPGHVSTTPNDSKFFRMPAGNGLTNPGILRPLGFVSLKYVPSLRLGVYLL